MLVEVAGEIPVILDPDARRRDKEAPSEMEVFHFRPFFSPLLFLSALSDWLLMPSVFLG